MLCHIVTPFNRELYESQLSAMFRQRKELFVDRLGWRDMNVSEGEERDEADADLEVEYLLTLDREAEVVGSCRLSPSTGACLLKGPLAGYLDAPLEPDAGVWELTRFAPATDPDDKRHGRSVALLGAGILEWAMRRGVRRIYGIAEPPLMALAGQMGWRLRIEGRPVEFLPGRSAFAFSVPVETDALRATRKGFRLTSPATWCAPPSVDDPPMDGARASAVEDAQALSTGAGRAVA